METLKLLPSDTRIELKNPRSLKQLFNKHRSKILNELNSTTVGLSRYESGKTRLSIKQLENLSKHFNYQWKNNIVSFGLEASKHRIHLNENTILSNDIVWLLGFHLTENSETPKSFGVCNSEPKLIIKSIKALEEIGATREFMRIEIRYLTKQQKNNIIEILRRYFKGIEIRFRRLDSKSMTKQPLYTLRINSRLIKDLINNLEKYFIQDIGKQNTNLTTAFLQGIYDADGWFNKAKKIIVLSQVDKNIIDLVCKSLEYLKIRRRREYWKYRNRYACVIIFGKNGENIKKFLNCVGFSHPLKTTRVKDFLLLAQVDPKTHPNRISAACWQSA